MYAHNISDCCISREITHGQRGLSMDLQPAKRRLGAGPPEHVKAV